MLLFYVKPTRAIARCVCYVLLILREANGLITATAPTQFIARSFGPTFFIWLLSLVVWSFVLPGQSQAATDTTQTTSYSALADLLENPQTRAQLVNELRTLAAQPEKQLSQPAETRVARTAPSAQAATTQTPASRIAFELQWFATNLKKDLAQTWQVVRAIFTDEPLPGVRPAQWQSALISFAVALGAVLVVGLSLRMVENHLLLRLSHWVEHESGQRKQRAFPFKRNVLAAMGAVLVNVVFIFLVATPAYFVLIGFTNQDVQVSLFAAQFLSAFVMVEITKALPKAVYSVRFERLRVLPLSNEVATYWGRWLMALMTVTGYSLLLVVPMVKTLLTPGVGRLLGLLIMTMVYGYAVTVVWQNRHDVNRRLLNYAQHASAPVFGTLIHVFARIWHWVVLAYFTVLFVVTQTDQQNALDFMAHATVQSAIAVLVGALLAMALSSLLMRHIRLPDNWRKALPLLEPRINAYVPAFLRSLRLLILVVVCMVVLDAWQAFDLTGWLSSDQGQVWIGMIVHVGVVLLIAALVWTVLASIIEHRLGVSAGKNKPTEREKTLLMLFRSAAAVVIFTMTALIVLSQIGINIGPLIAGAGVAGLAIGFGAQKLVQDVITGIFIQLENGMNQNDVVEVVGLFGTVEKITIRSVVIRTLDGGYHLIPFSSIDKLTNHMRDYGCHYGEYTIGHQESVDETITQLQRAFAELKLDPELAPAIIGDIDIPGVTSLNERGLTIRVLIKTTPGMQWAVQRGFNRLVKKYFDAAGIEIPYPQTVLHFGRDMALPASPKLNPEPHSDT